MSSTASFSCMVCQKAFRKRDALRRHKRTHALQKPVLLCPSQGCQAYFSTTFNLQHHIRKVHLQLLSHGCSFPGCSKTFAMRVSTVRNVVGIVECFVMSISLFEEIETTACECSRTVVEIPLFVKK